MPRILLAEDDPRLSRSIAEQLRAEGKECLQVYHSELALRALGGQRFDLMLLDLSLPKQDGYSVCEHIRRTARNTPILVITVFSDIDDKMNAFSMGVDDYLVKPVHFQQLLAKVEGCDAGADDYLMKPFDLRELHVRIRAVAKRHSGTAEQPVQCLSDLELDSRTRAVSRAGAEVRLTPKGFTLLEYLLRNAGRVVPHSEIAQRVWGIAIDTGANFIDVYINQLRRKINREHPVKLIHTKPGVGFIAFFGICVQNGVILVQEFNDNLHHRLPLDEAIISGVKKRIRPVVMTALMASLGLLPAAMSTGIGSESQKPLAIVIIGGLITATVFILLVFPIVFRFFRRRTLDRKARRVRVA